MRTSVSFNLTQAEAQRTKKLARARGFDTTSQYFRFLLSQDDVDLISEHELVKRSKEVERLYRSGKLVQAESLEDLL